jgi:hypothetical protein
VQNCNISSSYDFVYKGRWLTQAGYWFILRFCEHFTCLSHRRSWHGLTTLLFSNFLFTNLFSITISLFLYYYWHLFFYFISNNNCRLSTINIVSFIFFYYRESKPPFFLHYEKSSPVNIVSRKINWPIIVRYEIKK